MGTEKRDRQKANKAAKLEAERAAAAKAKRIQTIRNLVIAGVLLLIAFLILSKVGG